MKIYCDDPSVFEDQEHRGLERLLMRVRLGQHQLILDDPDGFFESPFFAGVVAPASQLEVRELLDRQAPALADRGVDPVRAPGPRAELVHVALPERTCRREGDNPVWEIDPATAGDWSEAPLRLLLENDNDWHLVEAAARVYGRPTVPEAQKRGFLRRDQRGGKTEVRKAVERCDLAERVFVLMDSDRDTVAGPEDKPQRDIRHAAKTRPNVKPFILRKREVENYLPEVVWRAAVEEKRTCSHKKYTTDVEWASRLRSWRQLPEADKDIVDLETVFPDAKDHIEKFGDPTLIPDASTLESRAGAELSELLDAMEVWL